MSQQDDHIACNIPRRRELQNGAMRVQGHGFSHGVQRFVRATPNSTVHGGDELHAYDDEVARSQGGRWIVTGEVMTLR